MFSNVAVGLLLGLGVGAWVYSKAHRQTGGNHQNALLVGGIVGLIAFIVVVTLLSVIFKN